MSTLPTFQEMWSMYLFGSKEAPKGEALLNDDLIRGNLLDEQRKNSETIKNPNLYPLP